MEGLSALWKRYAGKERMGMWKEAVIDFAAFILALLAIWLLPLGFSRAGGAIVVAAAFLIAVLARLAESAVPLWQIVLLLGLLLAAVSYLFDRRLGTVLYRSATGKEERDGPNDERIEKTVRLTKPVDDNGKEADQRGANDLDDGRQQTAFVQEHGYAASEAAWPNAAMRLHDGLKADEPASDELEPALKDSASALSEPAATVDEPRMSSDESALRLDDSSPAFDERGATREQDEDFERENEHVERSAELLSESASYAEQRAPFSLEPIALGEDRGVAEHGGGRSALAPVLLPMQADDEEQLPDSAFESLIAADEPARPPHDWLDELPVAMTPDIEAAALQAGTSADSLADDGDSDQGLLQAIDRSDAAFLLAVSEAANDSGDESEPVSEQETPSGSSFREVPPDITYVLLPEVSGAAEQTVDADGEHALFERQGEQQTKSNGQAGCREFQEDGQTAGRWQEDREWTAGEQQEGDRLQERKTVRTEVVQAVASELRLNRRRFGAADYERCLLQCLAEPLSDRDYYVLARLLMEHYVIEQQYDKLALWLDELANRFCAYPAVAEELALWRQSAATLANSWGENDES
ncbi:hypothetical protein [Geobacillus sp. 46C-IIa]|uniref:hypothetical protein n=1 Tax=Geobacillus sp. 46C-IIa TaxID=1963025 RepID=UPI001CC2128C|nr:hypothetical protein [Geobacillus sp. 46C-IIa]